MGWPIGEVIEGTASQTNFGTGTAEIKNNVWAGCTINHQAAFDSTFVPMASNNNTIYAAATGAMLTDPFNATTPNAIPAAGSPVLTGADFTSSKFASPFFDKTVTFRGAFGTTNWMACWSNFDSDNTPYTSVNEVENVNNISVYPNPFTNNFTLNITTTQSENLNITLVDISGRLVKEINNEVVSVGAHTYTINTSNVQAGVYFVKIQNNNESTTIKLVCNK